VRCYWGDLEILFGFLFIQRFLVSTPRSCLVSLNVEVGSSRSQHLGCFCKDGRKTWDKEVRGEFLLWAVLVMMIFDFLLTSPYVTKNREIKGLG
jgi:hypothetical protein